MGCGNESTRAISQYSGDGSIQHLPKPGVFGIDGIEIKFPDIDLSKDHKISYSLDNLPTGDPYNIFFVVPEPAPLADIKNNKIHIKAQNKAKTIVDLNLKIGEMINNIGMGLNRFYCNNDFHTQPIPCQFIADSIEEATIEITYLNSNLNKPAYGYLLLARGGYK